nr:RecName: Full=Defensin D3; AltName: Full=Antimicrobial peptide D3; AltName: Full=So-D3 [Spinacia oleracea]
GIFSSRKCKTVSKTFRGICTRNANC